MNNLLASLVVVAATTTTAFAQPAETPAAPAETITVKDWYGWQILGADAAVFTIAAGTHDGQIALGWIGTGATVHAAHGHIGRSVGSVGLRVGLPLAGFFLGLSSAKGCSGELCDLGPALAGGLVGMGVAEVADVAMGYDETQVAVPRSTTRWTPVASVRHSGATVGFAARF